MPFVGNGCLGRRRERFVEVVCSGEMLEVFFNCSYNCLREIWVQKKGKLDISHRYNRIPLLPSGPGGVLQELVVYDLPDCKGKQISIKNNNVSVNFVILRFVISLFKDMTQGDNSVCCSNIGHSAIDGGVVKNSENFSSKGDFKPLKIAVGLSGGVDSSVAALLLKQAGHNVVALFMQNWHDTTGTLHGDCEWEEDKFVAEMVAKKLGIPFHFVDLSETYRKRVVDYMFSEYEKGRTPNPDVLCNREIKFDAFLQCALELGVDYVATGHYCKKDEFVNEKGETVYRILAGDDKNKDQSYFLCQLSQEQLSKALFPIGDIDKPTVRKLAKEAGLQSADKKDSQGICFVGKVDLPVFLQQKLKPKEGKVVEIFATEEERAPFTAAALKAGETVADAISEPQCACAGLSEKVQEECCCVDAASSVTGCVEYSQQELEMLAAPVKYKPSDGKVIGKHIGAQFYTIGQRKGLNIGGHKESIFVISTDIEDNVIYVGEGHSHPGLYRRGLKIDNSEVHWIREDLRMAAGESRRYLVRIRYRQPLQEAFLYQRPDGLYIIFDKPQRGISAGQFAAWYTPGEEEMIGSGVI